MRIAEIVLSNYRAFYNETGQEIEKHVIDFSGKSNLLMYGENGSGKSSVFKGLRDLFRSSVEPDCKVVRNVFSRELELNHEPFIEVKFIKDEKSTSYMFSSDPYRTNTDNTLLKSVARARSFMTYRDLMRIHFVNGSINLFDFLFGTGGLLSEFPNPASSQPETSIKMNALWQAVQGKPDEVNIGDFRNGANQILSDLSRSLNALLRYFDKSLEVNLEKLTQEEVQSGTPVIGLSVKYFGIDLDEEDEEYYNFLNEARLSALAICIFLAAHLSVPTAPYEILVLDDIFTGLDTSNRMPLLDILTAETIEGTDSDTFTNHQIILTTYDRQWFELARHYLGNDSWQYQEIYIDRHSEGFDQPALRPGSDNVMLAKHYFDIKHYPACANHQRKVCEKLIKQFLPDYKKYDALPNGDIKPVDKLNILIERFESYLTKPLPARSW